MTPKEEINTLIEKLIGKSRSEMISILADYEVQIDIEDKYDFDKQLLYAHASGVIQIVRNVEQPDGALKEYRESDDPIYYDLINKYK